MMSDLIKLHLGCGDVNFSGWINADIDSIVADVRVDLTKSLPFADGAVSHVFSEHFIEHISRAEAVNFFVECRRVLSANGAVRITTPSLRFLIASYLSENKFEWGDLWQPDTPCLMVNEGMRSWGHQFVYDAPELVRVLMEAGFSSISFKQYRKSEDEVFCNLESRPFHNELIVEAIKAEKPYPEVDRRILNSYEEQWVTKLNTGLVTRLVQVEQTITDQATHVRNVEAELTSRGQHIAGLEQTIAAQGLILGTWAGRFTSYLFHRQSK